MTAAEQRVRETIIKHGPIRFDTLMTLALYEPEIGYYQTHMPGQDSDYQTSPTLTPWFGRLIARRLEQMWQQIESPDRFDVIEIGAGNAALAESAMDSLDGAFREALRWTFVEPFDPIRSAQVERMGADGTWVLTLEEIEPSTGCLLANEVLDNFPVRSFEIGIDTTFEIYIGLDDDRLVEILEPCDVARPELEVGDRFEINDHVDDWCKRAAAAIQHGFMLVIDYGDEEPALFTRRPAGTIVTYSQG
ncbi:MAG: SAM-dependent methyltransferase, partial [Actinomycetota bacterium]